MERIPDTARPSSRPPASGAIERPPPLAVPFAWAGGALFVLSLAWFGYSYVVRFGRPVAPGPVLEPILIDAALFSAFALHHSLLARARFRTALRRRICPAVERSLYTWVASLLFLAVCWLWQPVPGVLYRFDGAIAWIGYAVQIAGVVLTVIGARAVDALELAGIRPVLRARAGLPPIHVPLETGGPYRIVRHPLYLAWALLVFGTPDMTATRFAFASVSTAYVALAIPFEERGLVDAFGAEYERYRRRVRWRMVPFVY